MEYSLILNNNNRVSTTKTKQKNRSILNEDLSFHFAFNGNENFTLKKKKLRIFPDSFLTMNPGTAYLSEVDSTYPVQMMTIHFDKEFVGDFKNSYSKKSAFLLDNYRGGSSCSAPINETIYPFIGDMKYNIRHLSRLINNHSQDEFLINEHLYHTLLNYNFLYNKEKSQVSERLTNLQKGTREEIYKRLNLAKEYLYSNYNQNINLQQLAGYSCLSVTHLIRTFRQAFHMTPHQFLMRIRMNRAKFLLNNTSYPISEVVNIIGLDSTSTFIKMFKQQYQTTPLKFRRSFLNS